MVRGSPCMCMRQMPAPLAAAASSAPGSSQRANIVDDVGARGDRGAHHFGFAGVHRDEHRGLAPQGFDHRDDTFQFFVETGGARTGARGFAAHVDDARAFGDHAARLRQRRGTVREPAAIGEGIGCDVQDTHHHGRAEIEDSIPALPLGGVIHRRPPAGMELTSLSAGRQACR